MGAVRFSAALLCCLIQKLIPLLPEIGLNGFLHAFAFFVTCEEAGLKTMNSNLKSCSPTIFIINTTPFFVMHFESRVRRTAVQAGGLIAGSTFHRGMYKKTQPLRAWSSASQSGHL